MAVKRFKIKGITSLPKEFELEFTVVVPAVPLTEEQITAGLAAPESTTSSQVETFHARAEMPGITLLNVAAAMSGEGGEQAKAIRDFLTDAIVATERDKWKVLLNDEDKVVNSDDLADITNWLLEQYGDRPTETV